VLPLRPTPPADARLLQLRFAASAARAGATKWPRSSSLHSSSATATPPAFGERARKPRPASHAPLAYARSLSASGISGLRARIANRRQKVQSQADVCQFGCAVATKKPGYLAWLQVAVVWYHTAAGCSTCKKSACDRIQSDAILNQNIRIVSSVTRSGWGSNTPFPLTGGRAGDEGATQGRSAIAAGLFVIKGLQERVAKEEKPQT
jgi:hypothetical protein